MKPASLPILLLLASSAARADDPAAAFAARDWERAASGYEQVVAAEPSDGTAWFRLATARLNLGREDAAIAAYEKAWELGASRLFAGYNLACLHGRAGRVDEAFPWLEKVVPLGVFTPEQMEKDADLAPLVKDPRWAPLMARAVAAAHPCHEGPHRQFDFWVGEWSVADASGSPVGTSRIEKILDGCVVLENWTGGLGRGGKSFNLWDTAKGRWQQTWVDDRGTLTEFHGAIEDGVMRYVSTSPDRDGTPRHRRLSFVPLPDGRVRQLSERTTDGGATWTVEYDFYYTRADRP